MGKYGFRLLPFCLDWFCLWQIVTLIDYLANGIIARQFGADNATSLVFTITMGAAVVLAMLNLSLGEHLLAYASWERDKGVKQRQWPNLALGTVLFIGGGSEILAWTRPGAGAPAFFLVDETLLKTAVSTIYGAANLFGGILLLAFARGAKAFNGLLLAIGAIGGVGNYTTLRDETAAALIRWNELNNRQITPEQADSYVNGGMYYNLALLAVGAGLLYLCREKRPAQPATISGIR